MWYRIALIFPVAKSFVGCVHAGGETLREEGPAAAVKPSLWRRLVWRNRDAVGLVDVSEEHGDYSMLNAVRDALTAAAQAEVGQEDGRLVITNAKGQKSQLDYHEPAMFNKLRQACGVKEKAFWDDVTDKRQHYVRLNSNSGSGCDVYFTKSRRFVIKMERKSEFIFFGKILSKYLSHLEKYPCSLLARYMGRYTLTLPDNKKIYFTVMSNICPPRDCAKRYDIKGCLIDRWQPPPKENGIIAVLKDENFLSDHIELGSNSSWFKRQFKIDIDFLCNTIGVTDYSLLIAYEPRDGAKIKSPVGKQNRVTSPRSQGITLGYPGIPVPEPAPKMEPLSASKPWIAPEVHADNTDLAPPNARALPDVESALHAVEGPNRIYYFGMVDWFMDYGWTERRRRFKKTIKYFSDDHSTVPPRKYARRMLSRTFDSMR